MSGWANRAGAIRTVARGIRDRATMLRQTDRRRFGRLKAGETLACNLGRVLDLSVGGLRLLSRRRLKGRVSVDLWDINRGLQLRARVVWSKRLGFRRHETGLRFLDIMPDTARDLESLGSDNRNHHVD